MVPDLFIVNGVERAVVWLQSWTNCSIVTVVRTTYAFFALFWALSLVTNVLWLNLLTLLMVGVIVMGLCMNTSLEYKQRRADETGQIVPSRLKHDFVSSLARCMMLVLLGSISVRGHEHLFSALSMLSYIIGLYASSGDVWPRTGKRLKKLVPALNHSQ